MLPWPIIVDSIKRRRDVVELKKGLFVELHELQYRLIVATYQIRSKLGTLDREAIAWMRPLVAKYEGLNRSESFLRLLDEALKLTDEQFVGFVAANDNARRGLTLKRYATPLLTSRIGQLSGVDQAMQNALLEVRAHLDLMNEDIDQYRFYSQLTFSSGLSSENRPIVHDNIRLAFESIASQAKIVVNLIEDARL